MAGTTNTMMNKIISISILLMMIIMPAVAHAGAVSSASNAVAALLQNNGLSVSSSNTNAQAMSTCVVTPACYNGLVGIAQQFGVTIDGVSGTSPLKTVALNTNSVPPKMPKIFYIPKMSNGNFNIEKIPSDILYFPPIITFLKEIFTTLLIFGFVYNMYMQLYRLTTGQEGQNKSYFRLFMQVFFAFIAFIIWENGSFFTQYLTMIDDLEVYITQNLTMASMSAGLLTTINHMVTIAAPSKGSGFEWYNPFTWAKLGSLAQRAVETFLMSGILLLIYVLYVVIYFIIYLFQLLILGFLFAVFPIAVALNVGEYASKQNILNNWFKWWFEVSTWGFALLLENVIFNVTVGNYLTNAGLVNSTIGFSYIVAIGLMIVMIAMLLAGPFLVHKVFGLTSGHEHRGNARKATERTVESGQKVSQSVATGGASVPADMAKETGKQAGKTAQSGVDSGASQTYGPTAGGIASGASTKLDGS
ncbi:MAG: hypothetical protein ACYDDB_04065 [bacterium]